MVRFCGVREETLSSHWILAFAIRRNTVFDRVFLLSKTPQMRSAFLTAPDGCQKRHNYPDQNAIFRRFLFNPTYNTLGNNLGYTMASTTVEALSV